MKFRAGLFENPYSPFLPEQTEAEMLKPDAREAARDAAGRSMVLLKNSGGTLPFNPAKKTAVIGPLGKNQHDLLGPWWGRGDDNDVVTVLDGIDAQNTASDDVLAGLHALEHRGAAHRSRGLRLERGVRSRGRDGEGGGPGRDRSRRDARDER